MQDGSGNIPIWVYGIYLNSDGGQMMDNTLNLMPISQASTIVRPDVGGYGVFSKLRR